MAGDYEIKLVFENSRARTIARWLEMHCDLDPEFPRNEVSTVYYDDLLWSALREKLNGDFLKQKVRLRWYSEGGDRRPAGRAFLELKSRNGSTVAPASSALLGCGGESECRGVLSDFGAWSRASVKQDSSEPGGICPDQALRAGTSAGSDSTCPDRTAPTGTPSRVQSAGEGRPDRARRSGAVAVFRSRVSQPARTGLSRD